LDVLVFPRDFKKYGDDIREGEVVIIEGRLQHDGDDDHFVTKLILSDLRHPELPDDHEARPVRLRCSAPLPEDILYRLVEVMKEHPGEVAVELEIPEGRFTLICRLPVTTNAPLDLLEGLLRDQSR